MLENLVEIIEETGSYNIDFIDGDINSILNQLNENFEGEYYLEERAGMTVITKNE